MLKTSKLLFRNFARKIKNPSKQSSLNIISSQPPEDIVKISESYFKSKYPQDTLNALYRPKIVKEVEKQQKGKIKIKENIYRYDVGKILDHELKNDILITIGFLRYRNFGLRQKEAEKVLNVFAENKKTVENQFPEMLLALSKILENIDFKGIHETTSAFRTVSRVFEYTSDTKVVENFIKTVNQEFHFFMKKDTFQPARLNILIEFFEDLMKHSQAIALLDDKDLKLKFTDGYDFADFMHNFYKTVNSLNLEQCLELLNLYYETVVLTSLKKAEGRVRFMDDLDPDFEAVFEIKEPRIQLLEFLDVAFDQFIDKIDLFEAVQVIFVYAKSSFTTSIFVQKFASSYLKFVKRELSYADDPRMLFKLLWALTRHETFPNEFMLWRVIELQILRAGLIPGLDLSQKVLLFDFFAQKGFGSFEFWELLLKFMFAEIDDLRSEGALKPSSDRLITALLFQAIKFDFLENSEDDFFKDLILKSLRNHAGKVVESIYEQVLIDSDQEISSDQKRALKISSSILAKYWAHFGPKHDYELTTSLINVSKRICRRQNVRKYIEKEISQNLICVIFLMQTFDEDFERRVLSQKAMLDRARQGIRPSQGEIVLKEDDDYGWGDFNRIFYNLVNNKEKLTDHKAGSEEYAFLLIWLKMGETHLRFWDSVKTHFHVQDMNLDIMNIKRRVLSHFITEEMIMNSKRARALGLLELTFLAGFEGLSHEIELTFQMKFSKAIDSYTFDEIVKIGLMMSRFGEVTEEFWELLGFFLDEKAMLMEFEFSADFLNSFERIREQTDGFVDWVVVEEGLEERVGKLEEYGVEVGGGGKIEVLKGAEERSEEELALILDQEEIWDFIKLDVPDDEFWLSFEQILDVLEERDGVEDVVVRLDWLTLRRAVKF